MIYPSHHVRWFLQRLLPPTCLLCGTQQCDTHLCNECRNDLPRLGHHCRRCSLPLFSSESLCGECLRKPPSFDRCITAFPYTPPISQLISQFKNRGQLGPGALLSRELAERIVQLGSNADLIMPVPLHWQRLLRRGFNQAHYISCELQRALNIPLISPARRVRPTTKQQQLSRRQRLRNLGEAFDVKTEAVKGKRIALVDDVVTTGATAEALSRILKRAGAVEVEVWALARTPEPN